MKYDFDEIVDRRDTNSYKWNVLKDELPMWVADMDFKIAPEIRKALEERVAHGVFGYSDISKEWYEAYISWWEKRHGLIIDKEWLLYSSGVVPAISSMIRKLSTPAEKIIVQTPIYNIFFHSIMNNGREVLESSLIYRDGKYEIDFNDLEQKLSDPQATIMILCNPHNPIGKVWDRNTLKKIGELCHKYCVILISDEIHCDLTEGKVKYTPYASVSEVCRDNSITCIAPTKAFNLAGLQTAAVLVPNKHLRHKVWRGLNTDEVAEPNAFAITATVAAFTKGEPWLEQLKNYLSKNKAFATEFIEKEIPQIKIIESFATYLLWIDCTKITENAVELSKTIREKTGLYVSNGKQFGGNGKTFLRINIACPKSILLDGLMRLKKGCFL